MDCDDVFFVLTSGPFPSGSPYDDAVERHVERCDACRGFATALRPAADLFHESLTPAEMRKLPGYRGRVPTPAAVRARSRVTVASGGGVEDGEALETALAAAIERIHPIPPRRRQLRATPAQIAYITRGSWVSTMVVLGFAAMTLVAFAGFDWLTR